jgi:hypothetical protein
LRVHTTNDNTGRPRSENRLATRLVLPRH